MAKKPRRPVPRPDEVTGRFWEACATRRRLEFQQCAACGHRWLPPSVVCPRCWTGEPAWVAAGGAGKVVSYAVYRRAYHPAFADLLPYVVAVVELEEGPRLVTNLVGVAPGECWVDMPVRLDFLEIEGATLPVFRPAGADAVGARG